MSRFQFILALLCAEWLVIFRTWLAPSALFMLVMIAGLRLYAMSFIPHWMGAEAVIGVAFMALFIHLRYWGRNARFRAYYQTYPTGVPWLLMATQTPKGAAFLEIAIAMCVVWFYFPKTPLRMPLLENSGTIAGTSALVSVFALALWNGLQNRRPREARQQAYKPVRAQSHRVRLPSVRELVGQFAQDG